MQKERPRTFLVAAQSDDSVAAAKAATALTLRAAAAAGAPDDGTAAVAAAAEDLAPGAIAARALRTASRRCLRSKALPARLRASLGAQLRPGPA